MAAPQMAMPRLVLSKSVHVAIGQMVEPNIEGVQRKPRACRVDWLKVSDVPGRFPQALFTALLQKPTPDVLPLMSSGLAEFAQRGWLEFR